MGLNVEPNNIFFFNPQHEPPMSPPNYNSSFVLSKPKFHPLIVNSFFSYASLKSQGSNPLLNEKNLSKQQNIGFESYAPQLHLSTISYNKNIHPILY